MSHLIQLILAAIYTTVSRSRPIQPERGKRCRDPIQASLPLRLRLEIETGFPLMKVLGFVAENTKAVLLGSRSSKEKWQGCFFRRLHLGSSLSNIHLCRP